VRVAVAAQAGRQRGVGMLSPAPLLPGGKGTQTLRRVPSSCWSRKKEREESFWQGEGAGGCDGDAAFTRSTTQMCPPELSAEVLQSGHR